MTDPSLTACQLNIRLIPKSLARLSQARQNAVLRANGVLRAQLISLLWNLKNTVDRATRGGGMILYVKDSKGKRFGLLVCQQVALYHYLVSNNSTCLARLVYQAQQYQNLINCNVRRTINEP